MDTRASQAERVVEVCRPPLGVSLPPAACLIADPVPTLVANTVVPLFSVAACIKAASKASTMKECGSPT